MIEPEADSMAAAQALVAQGIELLGHLPEDEIGDEIEIKTSPEGHLMVRTTDAVYLLQDGAVFRWAIGGSRSLTVWRDRQQIAGVALSAVDMADPEMN
jgi:hypothetical protein